MSARPIEHPPIARSIRSDRQGGVKPYRLNVDQFMKMIGAGVFPDHVRIELINGLLVRKMTRYPPHNVCVLLLSRFLRTSIPPDWIVSEEKPVVVGKRQRLEPDFALIRGPESRYLARDPHADDIPLVIEVSDSTYSKDRGSKWRLYSEARIPCYWVVNIAESRVEVYTDPDGSGRSAAYRRSSLHGPDDEIPIPIAGVEVGRVGVRSILPLHDPEGAA